MIRRESPTRIIVGREPRDGLPIPRFARPEWGNLSDLREGGHFQLHAKVVDRRCLEQLEGGDTALVQKQLGPASRRWERTREVVEKLGNRQYSIRMHGSGVTLRNRRLLKKLHALNPPRSDARATVVTTATVSSTTGLSAARASYSHRCLIRSRDSTAVPPQPRPDSCIERQPPEPDSCIERQPPEPRPDSCIERQPPEPLRSPRVCVCVWGGGV